MSVGIWVGIIILVLIILILGLAIKSLAELDDSDDLGSY